MLINKYNLTRRSKSIELLADKEKYIILERKNDIHGHKTKFYLMKLTEGNSKNIFISSLQGKNINTLELQALEGEFFIDYKGLRYVLRINKNKAEIVGK